MAKLVQESASSPESEETIRKFLKSHHSGVLATADAAAIPHAAAVYFSLNDDLSLLFSTKAETQKYKNVVENRQVAFVVYEEQSQTTVQVLGHVEVIENVDELHASVGNMFRESAEISHRELPPLEKLYAGEYVALRLVPAVIKMAVYARPDSGDDELFETLLFSE